jgi:hypothetical protein
MIEIKEGRLWIYNTEPESVYPGLDFELLSAYVCPLCKTPVLAYCVGYMNTDLLHYYRDSNSNKHFEAYSITEGGFYLVQDNHGKQFGYGRNCKYQRVGNGRGVYNSILSVVGWSSLHSTSKITQFVKAIERGEYSERGILVVEDICGVDEPIVMFDPDIIIPAFRNHIENEQYIAEKIEKWIGEYEEETVEFNRKFADVMESKLGKRRVKVADNQMRLF